MNWTARRGDFVFLELEGLGDQARFVRALDVVEVLHRRRDVGVAHPLLHSSDVGLGDHPRAERVAEVVEAQRTELRAYECRAVAAGQRGGVEVAADDTR